MEYLGYKNDKLLNGFWNDDLHSEKIIPTNKIKITSDLKRKVLDYGKNLKFKNINMDAEKIYDVVDFENLFEEFELDALIPATKQDKLNADLIKQNAELKVEVEKQKALNSQMLLEIAKLKQGGAV